MAKKITSKEEIANVGAISANNDHEIGNLLAEAMDKVGKDGVITVEEGKTAETTYEVVEGMQFDKGYLSPYFINRSPEMDCLLEDAYILIYEKKITQPARPDSDFGKGHAARQAAADHLRGRRRRSAHHAGGEQTSRRAEHRGREGPGFRRSAEEHARRHRDSHRRHVHFRRFGH